MKTVEKNGKKFLNNDTWMSFDEFENREFLFKFIEVIILDKLLIKSFLSLEELIVFIRGF